MRERNMQFLIYFIIAAVILIIMGLFFLNNRNSKGVVMESKNLSLDKGYTGDDYQEIYLAGGCFWGTEATLSALTG